MLEEMSSHGVVPDETTFTTLMQGFVEEGSIEVALRVKAKMSEMGCSPTKVMVNVLINGYCMQAGKSRRRSCLHTARDY
uniref:Pentatricopeptide repeat-containing protein n=1 Tax=Arundo donax TaxID=35708 RepID=A0A0A9DV33_ARUDO